MPSFFENKFWIIVLSLLALGALLVLAAGMGSMSFREAQDFGRNEPASTPANPADLVRTVLSVPLQTQLVFWFLVVGMFALIAMLLSPEGRRRLLRMLFRAVITYWVLYLFLTRYPQILSRLGMAFAPSNADVPVEAGNSVPPPAFSPPPSTSWITYAASLAILVLVAFLAAGRLELSAAFPARQALPVSLALTFIGLLLMATRRKAVSQLIGLITIENGIFLAGLIATLGLVAVPVNFLVLKRLLAIVETVRAGDPFVAANARRLQLIAWALLAHHRDFAPDYVSTAPRR